MRLNILTNLIRLNISIMIIGAQFINPDTTSKLSPNIRIDASEPSGCSKFRYTAIANVEYQHIEIMNHTKSKVLIRGPRILPTESRTTENGNEPKTREK